MTLKKRRERGIRSKLAAIEQRDASLVASKTSLLEARRSLVAEWRMRADVDAVYDPTALQTLKRELATYHERDRTLAEQIETVDTQRRALRQERDSQLGELHRILVGQEKLNGLLE
ncbi:hypothetical protein [Burkholderia sp. Nafp2/4-1b]|uniref:hypothetical protein n=1 Tax=Burkholderia sp. Nafp2/4-1b TaxID=2116686 RepID=UPI001F090E5F|nr:hypothetical protein [Burkholderia sp. Nafp2/4-1b]